MPKTVRQSMLEKGWEEKDIARAEEILYSEEKQLKHYDHLRRVNPVVYWMGLMLAMIGNMIIAVLMIPFFLVMTSIQLYIVIGTVGLVFGAMFNFLLRDIEHVDYRHHIIAGVFIPIVAAITIFVVINLANTFAKIMKISQISNPWLVILTYIVLFSVPYLIYKITDVRDEKKHKEVVAAKAVEPEQKIEEAKKKEPASTEEAWKVYQQKQSMDKEQVHTTLANKYRKYL
ncbi:hypothetical protein ACFL96_08985 [Thermoproteota archaeon]